MATASEHTQSQPSTPPPYQRRPTGQAKRMAKTKIKVHATLAEDVSAKVKKAIEDISKPFAEFVQNFASMSTSRAELAPKFMRAFGLWQAEDGGTFVEFCRVLVPEIGPSRNEYRSHPAYQAADYLRRLVAQNSRREVSPEERARSIQNAPASPTTALARFIKTLLPMIKPEEQGTLWKALHSELNMSDRQITRIQQITTTVDPVVIVSQPKGLHALGQLKLRMPSPAEEAA